MELRKIDPPLFPYVAHHAAPDVCHQSARCLEVGDVLINFLGPTDSFVVQIVQDVFEHGREVFVREVPAPFVEIEQVRQLFLMGREALDVDSNFHVLR